MKSQERGRYVKRDHFVNFHILYNGNIDICYDTVGRGFTYKLLFQFRRHSLFCPGKEGVESLCIEGLSVHETPV